MCDLHDRREVTLRDSVVDKSGIADSPDCSSLTNSPVAVTVNGGSLSMVRSSLTDTKDEPGIVVNSGTFSATDSVFSDLAYVQSNNDATVQNAGGAATIKRSLFQNDFLGLQLTGGSTTITDSTFYNDEFGISPREAATSRRCSAAPSSTPSWPVPPSWPATC